MFNKFFPNLCVKVNKLWAKLTRNDEVIDFMESGSVVGNPTLAGTESALTGIKIGDTKYKIDTKALSIDYTTTAPTADNTDGIKFVVLTAEPLTKYNGYIYLILESQT